MDSVEATERLVDYYTGDSRHTNYQLLDAARPHINPACRNDDGDNLLHIACKKPYIHIDEIAFLLEKGVDPKARNEKNKTPLEVYLSQDAGFGGAYYDSVGVLAKAMGKEALTEKTSLGEGYVTTAITLSNSETPSLVAELIKAGAPVPALSEIIDRYAADETFGQATKTPGIAKTIKLIQDSQQLEVTTPGKHSGGVLKRRQAEGAKRLPG